MEFKSFPDIEGFHNVVKYASKFPEYVPETVTYRMKVKLHGTNAGVRVSPNGEVAFQSRNQILSLENDNMGFARWGTGHLEYFKSVSRTCVTSKIYDLTIFGEWCGPGIMKGTAVSSTPNKMFVIFAVQIKTGNGDWYVVEPKLIKELMPDSDRPSDIKVLPFYGEPFVVDFRNKALLLETSDYLNDLVVKVEPCDPWVKEEFGIEGVCEGVVCYPMDTHKDHFVGSSWIPVQLFSDLTFKAKGEQHRVAKAKVAVQVDPDVLASIEAFVAKFCTVPRFEQGLTAVGGVADTNRVGEFLKWVGTDVNKESEAERESSGLTWEKLAKPVQTAARTWFIAKCKEI